MLQYERYGQGPILVLIHGSPGNALSWKGVGERLAKRFDIVALNLPGYENVEPPSEIKRVETAETAAEVEELIGTLSAPVTVAAHSYGGNVALHVALRNNVPIERLVLFEPVLVTILPLVGKHEIYENTKAVFDGYIRQSRRGEELAVQTMVDFWFGPAAFHQLPEHVREYLIRWSPKNVSEVEANYREKFTLEALAKIRMPVDVAYGTLSPDAAAEIAMAIAHTVANGYCHAIDGTNHALLATHPDTVAATIENAADGLSAPRRQ